MAIQYLSGIDVKGNLKLTGSFLDSSGDSGTAGQVLSSTGTGTNWINNTAAGITGVTAGTGLTGGGTSGTVTLNVIGGAGITANANDIAVDSTVLRTSGNQTSSGVKSFSTYIKTSRIDTNNGQQLVLNAGEAGGQATGQTNELVYLNAESGIQINSSPDNWSSGWAGRKTTYINNSTGDSSFSRNVTVGGDLTVSGGDITLSGTGRIQGVDTVSAGTDAVNKTYVDNAIAGVPQGDITSVTAGNGLTGGGTSGGVSLNVDTTVVRTTGAQTIAGAKIFSDDIRFNDDILDSGGDTGSAGQVLVATGQGSVNWVNQTNTNNFVNAATFNTSNGIITGTGSGSAGFTVDIDGRYPTGNAANQPFFLHLQQNTVGTTYGNGVAAVPSYYFGQLAGDNDGMRFYAESAASNDVTAVWEINDDLETGLSWLFRNKKTYSPYTAIDAMKIDGDGDVTIGKDLTITGGDIILSGTGRIQGVDTVTSATDAASKAYVDNAVAGVPQGDITSVAAGNGLTGGGTSGAVTLNVVGGYGITANADNITIDASVVTLTGSQALTNKTGSNSQWTNDEGYTTNTGDITAVTAGTNLNGGGTSGAVTLNLNSNINLDELNIGQGIELKESTDRSDLLQITSATSSWAGIQIRNSSDEGRWSFMTDGNAAGFYDDQQNDWAVNMIENGAVKLYNNGSEKLTTTSGGVQVNGTLVLNGTGRIQGVDTVSSGTDAANKTYVDNAIAGVPQGDITAVTVGNGLSGGGTSGSVNIAPNYAASSSNLILSAPTTTSTGAKTYTPYILVAESNPGVGSGAVNRIRLENINLDRFGNTLSVGKTIRLSRNTLSTSNSTSPIYVDNTSTGNGTSYNYDSDVSSYFGSRHMAFRYNGTVRGSISQSGTSNVAFNTSNSDERLKKNIEVWDENILEKFEEIEPKKFNYLEDEDGEEKTKGYIAQEMVDSFPEAYPTDFSEENYYNYNPSGMVVYLTKAIKELIEKNKQLENRIQTLENN